MNDESPPDLNINVGDEANVGESLNNQKPWFNGMKEFPSVKVLPPNN